MLCLVTETMSILNIVFNVNVNKNSNSNEVYSIDIYASIKDKKN